MPKSKINQGGLIKWVEKHCGKIKLSEELKACLDDKGNLSFEDIVHDKSQNVSHKAEVHNINGVVQFLTLKQNSVPFELHLYNHNLQFWISLNPKLQYIILFIDPTFKFLTPNPLAVKKTTLRLNEMSDEMIIYFKVCIICQ